MVLFVNACVRGDKSRTLALCREYLRGAKQAGEVVREVNLELLHLVPLSDQKVAFRSQLARAKRYEDDIFNLSHQFAEADDIVIGAPYWDLSFPAALKTYIEHVSVDGITFRFTPDAHYEGLCTARRITYITTSGSILSESDEEREAGVGTEAGAETETGAEAATALQSKPAPGVNLGYDYICAIARMFGIPEVRYAAAEGLDIEGIDIEAQLEKGLRQVAALLAEDAR